ncbi:MAG: hypothetical protein ACJAZO_002906 [Myxococcota bacterium]
MIWLLWLGLAWSQEPDVELDTDIDVVIYVFGDEALREARAAVARSLQPLGWTVVRDGADTVFAPPQRWIGRAVFTRDGRLSFREPVAIPSVKLAGADLTDRESFQVGNPDACGVTNEGDHLVLRGAIPEPIPQGPVWLTVKLYEDGSHTRLLWEEHQLVALLHGRYTSILGASEPLDGHARANGRWLVASIGGRDVLQALTADVTFTEETSRDLGRCPENFVEYDPNHPERWQAPPLAALSFTIPSKRKRVPHQRAALDASSIAVSHYRSVVQETATRRYSDTLPDELDLLWQTGTPLYGTRPLTTLEQRRRYVLDLWASRDTNRSGQLVCNAIEGWLANVVLHSEAPIVLAEYGEYEPRRTDGRLLPR